VNGIRLASLRSSSSGANFSLVKLALRELAPLAFTALLPPRLRRSVVFLKVGGDRVRINRLHWPAVIGLGLVGTTVYQNCSSSTASTGRWPAAPA
jgi:hypothetical protein